MKVSQLRQLIREEVGGVFNENLNMSDVRSSKIIYTVLPYYSNSQEVNQNGVKSFMDFKKAEEYTWTLDYQFDVVKNELI